MVLAAAVLLLPSLGDAPIERAEIYFLDAARGMVESGDWLVPRYEGQPFFDKPPLTYWLMAASFRAFGFALSAGRLPAVLSALGVVLATLWLGRVLFGRRAGLLAGAVVTSTLLFLSFGRVAMSDMLLTLWCTLAVAAAAEALAGNAAWTTGRAATVGLCVGLGFLTKGPIAVVVAAAGIAAVAWDRRARPPLRAGLVAGTLAALVGLSWFAAVGLRLGREPLEYFFLRENLERFAGETYDAGRSPVYYAGAFLAVALPWSLVFPMAAARTLRDTRPLLLWMAAIVVPMSLSRGKIDYYLLPTLPASAIVVARYLDGVAWDGRDRLWARGVLAAGVCGLAAVLWMEAKVPVAWLPPPGGQIALAIVVLFAALAFTVAALRPTPLRLAGVLAGTMAAVDLLATTAFLPAFRRAQPNAWVVEDVGRELSWRPDARLVVCGDAARVRRDLLFHVRVVARDECDVWGHAASRLPFLLLVGQPQRESLDRVAQVREVGQYQALPATALTLGGAAQGAPPERLVLLANYATDDPVAETKRKQDRKRALRVLEASSPAP